MRTTLHSLRLALGALLLTSVPPTVAHAQFYHVTLGVAGGLTVPTGNSTTPIDGGGGLSLALGRFSASAEGRVQNVYTKTGGFIKSAKQIQAVPVSFGLAVGLF